ALQKALICREIIKPNYVQKLDAAMLKFISRHPEPVKYLSYLPKGITFPSTWDKSIIQDFKKLQQQVTKLNKEIAQQKLLRKAGLVTNEDAEKMTIKIDNLNKIIKGVLKQEFPIVKKMVNTKAPTTKKEQPVIKQRAALPLPQVKVEP